jgi:MFS family permease
MEWKKRYILAMILAFREAKSAPVRLHGTARKNWVARTYSRSKNWVTAPSRTDPVCNMLSRRWGFLVLSVYMFLNAMSLGSQMATLPQMILHKECSKITNLTTCSDKEGKLYNSAQENAAAKMLYLQFLPAVTSLLAIPVIGQLGDVYGRRNALLLNGAGAVLNSAALWLIADFTTLVAIMTVANLGGGIFAAVANTFARYVCASV